MSQNKKRTRSIAREKFWSEYDKRGYECPDCGRRETQLRTGFEVHHKDGDASHNASSNLIALCRPCHNLREGKKPSVNDLELMQEQIKKKSVISHTTPLAESVDQANAIYKQNQMACKPNMLMYKIRRKKYVRLEVDFNTAKGWRTIDERSRDGGEVATPRLTEDSVDIANSIMKKYRGEDQPRNSNTALSTSYGSDVISAPPLLPDVCRNLAAELRPIVMNEENWEPWKPTI